MRRHDSPKPLMATMDMHEIGWCGALLERTRDALKTISTALSRRIMSWRGWTSTALSRRIMSWRGWSSSAFVDWASFVTSSDGIS